MGLIHIKAEEYFVSTFIDNAIIAFNYHILLILFDAAVYYCFVSQLLNNIDFCFDSFITDSNMFWANTKEDFFTIILLFRELEGLNVGEYHFFFLIVEEVGYHLFIFK